MFISKLLASEKTATKMFDSMNLSFEGARLNFERFSELAKNDIYVALQLLVDNFDKLSSQQTTLQKMFTARHWTKISALLASMGGNVETFVDSMTTSNEVNEDYEKQLNNLNTQLEQLQGKLKNANSVFMEMTKDLTQQFVPILNFLLDGFSELNDKSLVGLSTKATTVSSTLTVLGVVLYNIAKKMDLFKKSTGLLRSALNPTYLIILGVTTALSALYFRMKDVEKERKKEVEYLKEQNKLYKNNISSIETAERQIDAYESALQSLNSVEISEKWSTEIDFIKEAIETTKEYKNLMETQSLESQTDALNYKKKELKLIEQRKKGFEEELELIEMQKKASNRIFPRGSKEANEQNTYQQVKQFLDKRDIEFSYKDVAQYLGRINDQILGGTNFSFEELKKIYDKFDKVALETKKQDVVSMLAAVTNEYKDMESEILVITGNIKEAVDEELLESKRELAKSSLNIFDRTFKDIDEFEAELKNRRNKYIQDTGEELSLFTAYEHMKKSGLDDMMKGMSKEQKVQLINSKEMRDTATIYFALIERIKGKEDEILEIKHNTLNRDKETQKLDEYKISKIQQTIDIDKQTMSNLMFKIVYQDKINTKHEESIKKLGDIYTAQNRNLLQEEKRISLMDDGIDKLKAENNLLQQRKQTIENEQTIFQERVGSYSANLKKLEELKNKSTGNDPITGKPEFIISADKQDYNNIIKILKQYDDYYTKIQNTSIEISKNNAEQFYYWIEQAKAMQDYYDKLENLKTKQMSVDDKRFIVAGQNREDIVNKIDETQQKLINKNELSKKDIQLLEFQLSYYEKILGYIKDINKEQQESYSSILNTINALSSGQSMTPSFNSGTITSWLANAEGNDPFKGKAEALNFGITQYNNIAQNTFSQEASNIQQRIDIMKMQQSLLTDEEDIKESEERILREQIKLINAQAQAQSTQSIAGGVTSGITSGLTVGAINPLAGIAVGAMSVLGGLFGSSKAKEEARTQQRMLELQAETNRLLEIQNKNTESMRDFKEEGSIFGTAYAQREWTHEISVKNDFGKLDSSKAKYYTGLEENDIVTYSGIEDAIKKVEKEKEYWEKGLDYITTKTSSFSNDEDLSKFMDWYSKATENYNAGKIISLEGLAELNIEQSKYYATQLENIKDVKVAQEAYYKEWYGYEVDFNAQTKEIESETFSLRKDILNNYIDNAKQSYNDLGSVISNTFSTGYLNNYVKEVMGLDDTLNNLESSFTNFINAQIEDTQGFEYKTYEKWNALSKPENAEAIGLTKEDYATTHNIIQEIVNSTSELASKQKDVNQYTQEYLSEWIRVGGKISDVSDLIGYDLYSSISIALDEENYEDTANNLGSSIGKTISTRMKDQFINANYADEILGLNQKLSDYFNQDALNIRGIQAIGTELQKISIQAEQYQDRMALVNDLMNFNSDIEYQSNQSEITYSTGSTSTNYFNYYITNSAVIQDSIGFSEDGANTIVNMMVPYIEKYMENRY